jgi:uncharacterized SAM-dependent methyltransferase
MCDPQLKTIEQKMDVLIRLLALNMTADKSQGEQIVLLNKAKFQPKEIAEFIGTTPNSVRVSLSKMRRRQK